MKASTNLKLRQNFKIAGMTAACAFLFITLQCHNPDEWKPGDPQGPPPDPPKLYLPQSDTSFSGGSVIDVVFDWEALAQATIYEVQTDTLTTFSTGSITSTTTPRATIGLRRTKYRQYYYGRVRAGSPAWTWYTDWSETRRFILETAGL
jgi:hypothetical protein